MISKIKLLDKYLNLLLIFLFPTQLAVHFWPKFAFVFGIRVDYLSPSIYFTDILFLLLFIYWAIRNSGIIKKDWIMYRKYIYIIFAFCLINTFFSFSIPITFIRWLKFFELILLAYYVKSRRDIFSVKDVSSTLFYSLVFFSIIGILQVVRGETSGKIFYLLGERSFTLHTPGIALNNFLGINHLRAYSTFSHPNSLAGYYYASLLFMFSQYLNKKKIGLCVGLFIILVALLTTFSLSAFIGIIACALVYVFRNNILGRKTIVFIIFACVLISFCFAFFSKRISVNNISISQSTSERIVLAEIAGGVFSQNWFSGRGLNNFIPSAATNIYHTSDVWLLQPVHNIFLLIAAETGLIGLLFLCIIFYKTICVNIERKKIWWTLVVLFVLITGLFDHYWFTIQQNLLLLATLLGIFFREK